MSSAGFNRDSDVENFTDKQSKATGAFLKYGTHVQESLNGDELSDGEDEEEEFEEEIEEMIEEEIEEDIEDE